jgi:hypothetical protein
MIVVKVESIRKAWLKAKNDLRNRIWQAQQQSRASEALKGKSFWEALGTENGMVVKIDKYMHSSSRIPIPVITEIVFNDEQSYAWFMLRWA